MDRGPIFIGGLDRSGKTLLRLMLSSHPNLAITRRTYMWTRFYNRYGDLSEPGNFEKCLNAMLTYKHMKKLNPDPDRLRQEFWQGEPTYARLFMLFQQHYAEQLGKSRWGDQLGFIEKYSDPIFTAYPTAKMIHMIRDPRDSYEASTSSAQHRSGKVGRATARWLVSANLAARNQQRYPDRYKIVRYETLVTQREDTLREICAFVGEAFTPDMLTMENAIRFGDNDDDEANEVSDVARNSHASNTDHCQVMSKGELAFMQTYARQYMMAHDYQLKHVEFSLHDRLLFYVVDWPINLATMTAWRITKAN